MTRLTANDIEQITGDIAQIAFIGDIDCLVDSHHEDITDCANWVASLRKYADSLEKRAGMYYPNFATHVNDSMNR